MNEQKLTLLDEYLKKGRKPRPRPANPDVRQGRCWQVEAKGDYALVCFDAFGNRDHYDYFILNKKGERVRTYSKVPGDEMVAIFHAFVEKQEESHDKEGKKTRSL